MANRGSWEVRFTGEAQRWYDGLGPQDTYKVAAAIDQLKQHGPTLPRPRADLIKGSRFHNMKELRSVGRHLRVLFALDPKQRAILLVGGDKRNNFDGWYRENVPRADKLYEQHLRKEGLWPPRNGGRSGGRSR